jgi:hypothetical protein
MLEKNIVGLNQNCYDRKEYIYDKTKIVLSCIVFRFGKCTKLHFVPERADGPSLSINYNNKVYTQ